MGHRETRRGNPMMHEPSPVPADLVWQIKAATRELVAKAGKLDRAAQVSGLSTSHLQRCGSTADEHKGSVLPMLAVYLLEHDTGLPLVSRIMAAATGHDLAHGRPVAAASSAVPTAFTATLAAVGDLARETAEALEDGAVSPNEARSIYEAGERALSSIEQLRRAAAAAASAPRVVPIRTTR